MTFNYLIDYVRAPAPYDTGRIYRVQAKQYPHITQIFYNIGVICG